MTVENEFIRVLDLAASAAATTEDGSANAILDNLIADGRAKPMIVVMPLGHFPSDSMRAGTMLRRATRRGSSTI